MGVLTIYQSDKLNRLIILITAAIISLAGCRNRSEGKLYEIIIFHAGSLSVPFKQAAAEYEKRNPQIRILLEPSGSLVCARKVTELKRPCDIVASADHFVINELLIPDYALWSIRFTTNEIVIAFQDKAKYASEINDSNWFDILLRNDVIYTRSDPDSDPCGYRTIMTFKLAEKFYGLPGLTDKMISKNKEYIRPKEVDLIALVESNAVDYMFQYKSVAKQHDMKYIELPEEINLGDPFFNDMYKTVSVDVTGNIPSSKITVTGEYINYSLTILKDAPHSREALDFVRFLLGKNGMDIFKKNGQEPLIPFLSEQPDQVPDVLRVYLEEGGKELSEHDKI